MPRLDQLLVSQGLVRSRTRAQRLIRHGRVSRQDDGKVLTRPGEKCPDDLALVVAEDPEERYISRAGLKLEAVLSALELSLDGRLVLDVGQSTGGFTDCALAGGARHVIGIEVGHGQLDDSLRGDARVSCLEGLNARHLSESRELATLMEKIGRPEVAVMDVSFISQTLILPELATLLARDALLLSLVKPQFELGPGAVDQRGVVSDPRRYAEVEQRIRDCCASVGFEILHWQESPILGGDGNREFLLQARRR
ncbi:TlyA family RNA methyltransferase [Halomonas sp. H10-59]|uniref:TlyA family RNA methyltransferase n=1 Tax=Halomonas sp. H10-59 TaxID=2950874 RepID=A0AAU7KY05_9GAMM